MKRVLGLCAVLIALIVPVLAQDVDDTSRGYRDDAHHEDRGYEQSRRRLSPEEQQRFDSYYSRWLEYRRTNNRDEIKSMENRMRDVMSRNNIPSNVPFDQIASNSDRGYDSQYQHSRRRLSPEAQQRFDSYYSRWLEYRRTNNRDEIESMENRMRDVMSHNNIPSNVPFDQIASNGDRGYDGQYQHSHRRLSPEDQQRFDSYYSRWLEYQRTNNRDEIESMENRMRDVMSHNNIPSNVPFDQIASNGDRGYDGQYEHSRRRLSPEDQQRFDSYYSRWLEYRRTNNRDEIESMENRMRDVMSHNNIPLDIPFDRIASRR